MLADYLLIGQFKCIFYMLDLRAPVVQHHGDYIKTGSAPAQAVVLQVCLRNKTDGALFLQRNRFQR